MVEVILYIVSILAYGVGCYVAGKGDLLNLIPLMLLQKAKDIEDQLKKEELEDGV